MPVGTPFAARPDGTESTGQRLSMLKGWVMIQPKSASTSTPLISKPLVRARYNTPATIKALAEIAVDTDSEVHAEAKRVLMILEKPKDLDVDALVVLAKKERSKRRRVGIAAELADKGETKQLLKILKESESPRVQWTVALALCAKGPEAVKPQEAKILELVRATVLYEDQIVCHASVEALGHGAPAGSTETLVAALMPKQHPKAYKAASDILVARGKAAVPVLIRALGHEQASVRNGTLVILKRIGPDASEAIPALFEGFKENRRGEYYYRVEALAAMKGKVVPTAMQYRARAAQREDISVYLVFLSSSYWTQQFHQQAAVTSRDRAQGVRAPLASLVEPAPHSP